jgi:Domain of Unknown Function (DUF930)
MRWISRVLVVALCLPSAARAGPYDRQLLKLAPEERAEQACVLKGIDTIRRDGRLPRADRLETGATSHAVFAGTKVSTNGGAVRAKHRWYGLKFKCEVTKDYLKALSFTYELGPEIPEQKWEKLGLWR